MSKIRKCSPVARRGGGTSASTLFASLAFAARRAEVHQRVVVGAAMGENPFIEVVFLVPIAKLVARVHRGVFPPLGLQPALKGSETVHPRMDLEHVQRPQHLLDGEHAVGLQARRQVLLSCIGSGTVLQLILEALVLGAELLDLSHKGQGCRMEARGHGG